MTREALIKALTAPLGPSEIEWVIAGVSKGPEPWTTVVPYTDARAVMHRLDRHVGPFNWRVRYREAQIGEVRGVIATLEIRDPETGEWIWREDGAPPAGNGPGREEVAFKGGISGALKRAATAWGIGRELYEYPEIKVRGEHKFIPRPVLKRLQGLPVAFAEGKPLPPVVFLEPDGTDAKRQAV